MTTPKDHRSTPADHVRDTGAWAGLAAMGWFLTGLFSTATAVDMRAEGGVLWILPAIVVVIAVLFLLASLLYRANRRKLARHLDGGQR